MHHSSISIRWHCICMLLKMIPWYCLHYCMCIAIDRHMPSYFALFLVCISGMGFSVQSLFIKKMAEDGFNNSLQVLFMRGCFQLCLSYIVIFQRKVVSSNMELLEIIKISWRILLTGSLLSFLGTACIFLTTEYVSVGYAMVLDRQSIMFGSLFACVFLGEPWFLKEFIATVVSLMGIVLIAEPGIANFIGHGFRYQENVRIGDDEEVSKIGITYGFLAALFAAGSYTTIRAMGTVVPVRWEIVTFVQGTMQFTLSLPCMYLLGHKIDLHLSSSQWGLAIAAAVIGTLSQYAQTLGMQMEKLAVANTIRTVDVLFALLWQWLFTHDSVTSNEMIGTVCVLVGIFIIMISRDADNKENAEKENRYDYSPVTIVTTDHFEDL